MKKPVTILENKQVRDFSANYTAGQRIVYFIFKSFVPPLLYRGDLLLLHRPTKNCKDVFIVAQIINFKWCTMKGEYAVQAYEKGFTRKKKGMNFE